MSHREASGIPKLINLLLSPPPPPGALPPGRVCRQPTAAPHGALQLEGLSRARSGC